MLTSLSGFAPSMLLALGMRAAARSPQMTFETVTTNVPGPQLPLYAAGRRMVVSYPYVPVAGAVRIVVAIFSYDGASRLRGHGRPRRRARHRRPLSRDRGGDRGVAGARGLTHQPSVPAPPLNGPCEVGGDPAAVEPALLRLHDLVVEQALVHPARIERDVIAQRRVRGDRVRVGPGGGRDDRVRRRGRRSTPPMPLNSQNVGRVPDGVRAPAMTSCGGT